MGAAVNQGARGPIQLLKGLIWVYVSLGVVIILAIGFAIFVLPLFSPDGISTERLDLMEKILLYWGLILFPFLIVARAFVRRRQREKKLLK
jgi:Na+-driven multidrug efflux pump